MVRCSTPGCTKQRRYAPARGQPAQYCGAHAPHDWPDVVAKRCSFDGCPKRPSYGLPGDRAYRCSTHAMPTMIDLKHKPCGVGGCMTIPSFGPLGGKAVRCVTHAAPDMVDVKNKPSGKQDAKLPPVSHGVFPPIDDGLLLLHDVAHL